MAQDLVDRGQSREAIRVLRREVEMDEAPYDVRLMLAELYRSLGCPDQAGRWGIVVKGWTTPIERDRLGRLLGASGPPQSWRGELLALPGSMRDNPDLIEVLEVIAPAHRERFRARLGHYPPERPSKSVETLETVAGLGILVGIVALLLGGLGAFVVAPLSFEASNYWVLLLGGIAAGLVGVGLIALGGAFLLKKKLWQSVIAIAVGVAIVAVVAAGFALLPAASGV
ncbi:hypothetical protein FBY40_3405 [Microbacterium sp. SLBN-154]|uniref:hypothetical protein n=1 Tax=Microbacterium sp. SLBN-154 TaxID=2768458 RepID=UPI0011512490|nr:hypothetical protein [Microbacterium sp. SLBN-154]TQK20861.1 hypothetical protein FBY40_3405 [Microbacterium sp. SLBN-154]